jgi:hypothetical protein
LRERGFRDAEMRNATPFCLPALQRRPLLGEPPREAEQGLRRCRAELARRGVAP